VRELLVAAERAGHVHGAHRALADVAALEDAPVTGEQHDPGAARVQDQARAAHPRVRGGLVSGRAQPARERAQAAVAGEAGPGIGSGAGHVRFYHYNAATHRP